MVSTAEKVFLIPELLEKIIDCCERLAVIASLARTSRQTFHCAIPFLWNTIKDSSIIFALLQGVEISGNKENGLIIKFPEDLSEISFSRLNLYAPHVETLFLFGNPMHKHTWSNWQPLLTCSEKTPLLPNLISLNVFWACWPSDEPMLPWMLLFLSPSMSEIQVVLPVYDACRLSEEARWFLVALAQRCPRMHTIGAFSQKCSFDPHSEDSALAGSLESDRDFGSLFLELFAQIKTLDTDVLMANLIGQDVIAKLPNLEHLDIDFDFEEYHKAAFASANLDSGAFPSLSCLTVDGICQRSIFLATWGVPSLLRNLTSLEVGLDIKYSICPCCTEEDNSISADEVASAICSQSPLLKKLEIKMHNEYLDYTFPRAFKILDQLPLECLTIWFEINSKPFKLLLPSSFPHLETLVVDGCCVHLSNLRYAALAMPRLRTLSILLEITDDDLPHALEPCHTHQIQLIAIKDPVDHTRNSDTPERVVRFLLSLWPHVELPISNKRNNTYKSWADALGRIRLSE